MVRSRLPTASVMALALACSACASTVAQSPLPDCADDGRCVSRDAAPLTPAAFCVALADALCDGWARCGCLTGEASGTCGPVTREQCVLLLAPPPAAAAWDGMAAAATVARVRGALDVCGPVAACGDASDCASGTCHDGLCTTFEGRGVLAAVGGACTRHDECASGECVWGACLAPTCDVSFGEGVLGAWPPSTMVIRARE